MSEQPYLCWLMLCWPTAQHFISWLVGMTVALVLLLWALRIIK